MQRIKYYDDNGKMWNKVFNWFLSNSATLIIIYMISLFIPLIYLLIIFLIGTVISLIVGVYYAYMYFKSGGK